MHNTLVHAQHSCACTAGARDQGRDPTKKQPPQAGPAAAFYWVLALVPGRSSACTRVLCMHWPGPLVATGTTFIKWRFEHGGGDKKQQPPCKNQATSHKLPMHIHKKNKTLFGIPSVPHILMFRRACVSGVAGGCREYFLGNLLEYASNSNLFESTQL